MRKFIYTAAILLFFSLKGHSQNIGINSTGATPDASSMLDIVSTTKGLLIPRMTTAQKNAITAPANGLLVFDTDIKSFYYYDSSISAWVKITGNGWSLTGNSGTSATTNFLGTTDAVSLNFKVNNYKSGLIDYTANSNTGFGYKTLNGNTTGSDNSAFGYNVLQANTTGSENTAVGYVSQMLNTSGSNNTSLGAYSLYFNTSGSYNTSVGMNSLGSNTNGNYNSSLGSYALSSNSSGFCNSAVGYSALNSNSTGSNNTATGHNALLNNSTASNNCSYGFQSSYNNTTGGNNVVIGFQSAFTNSTGSNNTYVGYQAGYSNAVSGNVFIGYQAGYSETGSNKLYIANSNTTVPLIYGDFSTARIGIGTNAPGHALDVADRMRVRQGASGTAGIWLYQSAPAANRAFIGMVDDNNVGLYGSGGAGWGVSMNVTTGNTGIGCTSPQYKLHVVGDIASSATIRGVNAYVTGAITACSDARYKRNIVPLQNALSKVLKMRGTNYYWKTEEFPEKQFNTQLQVGFIAQEMERILPEVVTTDVDGYKGIDYTKLSPVLVEAIKEQQVMIELLKTQVIELEKTNALLTNENQQILNEIEKIKVIISSNK